MLSKHFINALKNTYCVDDYTQIEGFWEAYNDELPSRKHCLHHKYGIVLNKTKEQLKYMGLYYHRYARELQIMLVSDHSKLHSLGERNPMYGNDKFKGENNPMYGKNCEDHPNFGKHCYNNGVIGIRAFDCPEGFVTGKLKRK